MSEQGDDFLERDSAAMKARLAQYLRAAEAAGYHVANPSVQAALITAYMNGMIAANLLVALDRCGDYLRDIARQGKR